MLVPAAVFMGSYYLARGADQGLADFLGLHTLRHGTNPISWVGIHVLGAMPKAGGSRFGGDANRGFDNQNIGRFYFQGEYKIDYNSPTVSLSLSNSLTGGFFERFVPKTYALSSCQNFYVSKDTRQYLTHYSYDNRKSEKIKKFLIKLPGTIVGAMIPNVKFRMSERKVTQLYPDYTVLFAYSTDQWQHPLQIGLIGTIWASCSYRTPIHMWNNPKKVVAGAAMMALTGLAAFYCGTAYAPILATHKVVLLAGAALAVV